MKASEAMIALQSFASPKRAMSSACYFKTGPGQYGEGDRFIGVRVPDIRRIAREFKSMPLEEVHILISSPIHEERLLALLILVGSVAKCGTEHRKKVYQFYMEHTLQINNWDLVDTSAPAIVGGYLVDRSRKPLTRLAKSSSLWERRISIIATQHFIRLYDFQDTITIGRLLLNDEQDLIHKAAGWMLREVGERDLGTLESFLRDHAATMPRTMLRYAIEHFPEPKRIQYLSARAK